MSTAPSDRVCFLRLFGHDLKCLMDVNVNDDALDKKDWTAQNRGRFLEEVSF